MTSELDDRPSRDMAAGFSRREAMTRAAVVGGSLVWAAPVAQRLGHVAAHAETSPPPSPPPPPPPTIVSSISYVALVFTCNGTTYRAKWEAGGTAGRWVDVTQVGASSGSTPNCDPPTNWDSATGLPKPNFNAPPGKGAIQVSVTGPSSDPTSVTFTLPSGCSFQDGAAVAKGGQSCAGMTATGRTITFQVG